MHISLSLLSVLFSCAATQLRRRDTPLVRANIPITFNSDRRYVVNVNMSTSPRPQAFTFVLSTSTGYTSVIGTNCTACSGSPAYNASLSTSVQSLAGNQGLSILGDSVDGSVVKETCSLLEKDGTGWVYPNQTIIVANESSPIFSSGVSGVVGLGTNSPNGSFSDTIYGQWLSHNPTRTNFSFGMDLNPPKDGSPDGGMLHWIVPDPAAYQGTISWKNQVSVNASSVHADWIVGMDSFSFSANNGPNISATGQQVIIDPYFNGIFLPQSVARAIFAGISGATSQASDNPSETTGWAVPCGTNMTLYVQFGSIGVTLKEDALIRSNGSSCVCVLEEWKDSSTSQYLFGATFISAVYLIFAVSGSQHGSLGFGMRPVSSNNGLQGAAIAGIVIGSVAIVVVAVFTAVLVYRSRTKKPEAPIQEITVNPFITGPSSPDEHRGLLMPLTPTSADPLQMRFSVVPESTPYMSMSTTPISTAYPRQTLSVGGMSTVAEIHPLDPPPAYTGGHPNSEQPGQDQARPLSGLSYGVNEKGRRVLTTEGHSSQAQERPLSIGSSATTGTSGTSEKRRHRLLA